MLSSISKIFFEADKPPHWISYVKAGLVIVGAETFAKFSTTMFEYLLHEDGSGKYLIFSILINQVFLLLYVMASMRSCQHIKG